MQNELVGLYVEENPPLLFKSGGRGYGGEDVIPKTVLAPILPILASCQEGICQN